MRNGILLSQRLLFSAVFVFIASFRTVYPLGVSTSPQRQSTALAGDWAVQKSLLRETDCCVVSVSGLESHLKVLQEEFADNGPSDVDLRMRVRVTSSAYDDCLRVRRSILPSEEDKSHNGNVDKNLKYDACTLALEELARGVASLADGSLEGIVEDVFVRIVCASNYRARDPPFHTDKAPFRGYVTLRGVGTEFMTRPCTPMEYMTLRTLGEGKPTESLRPAEELEFIVMKGDYYDAEPPSPPTKSLAFLAKVWKRATACVHRSPPGKGGRRVIVSFDLADGDDNREWFQVGQKREWRNGLTQRKSHLVA